MKFVISIKNLKQNFFLEICGSITPPHRPKKKRNVCRQFLKCLRSPICGDYALDVKVVMGIVVQDCFPKKIQIIKKILDYLFCDKKSGSGNPINERTTLYMVRRIQIFCELLIVSTQIFMEAGVCKVHNCCFEICKPAIWQSEFFVTLKTTIVNIVNQRNSLTWWLDFWDNPLKFSTWSF